MKYQVVDSNVNLKPGVDGPFDTPEQAIEHLGSMCGEYTTPELLGQFIVTLDDATNSVGLYKIDGEVIDGWWVRRNRKVAHGSKS